MYLFQLGVGNIIEGTVLVLLCLTIIPVLYRTVVAGDTAVNFSLLSTFRTGEMLSADVAMLLTYGIGRRNGVIRQAIILCDLTYQRRCCLPVRKFLSQECVEYSSGCIQSLQIILYIQCVKNISGIINRQMGAVCVIRSIALFSCCLDIRITASVVFGKAVCGGFRRCCLQIEKLSRILLLIVRKTVSHMLQNLFRKLLGLRICHVFFQPACI